MRAVACMLPIRAGDSLAPSDLAPSKVSAALLVVLGRTLPQAICVALLLVSSGASNHHHSQFFMLLQPSRLHAVKRPTRRMWCTEN